MDDRTGIEELWARVPHMECRGLCQDSCGPIAMSVDEDQRLRRLGVEIPPIQEGLAAVERGEAYHCPALVEGRCRVHPDRPLICRLWGATASMPCPHGCTPADRLTQEESFALLRESARVGGGMTSGLT